MLDGEKEHMFDSDSFQEEITSKEEAEAAYKYFAHNLTGFRNQLSSEGESYESIEKTLRQCWLNLIESSQKVGYTNDHLERMAKLYGRGATTTKLALPKKTNK